MEKVVANQRRQSFLSLFKRLKNKGWLILTVAVIVFASRLPFINVGYGDDPDAWRTAQTAKAIATSGEYKTSRLPGHPVQDILYSLVWKGGPSALNGITALLSALGIAFFALSMKTIGNKDYLLAGLALAFIPVVYISSTNSMDYMWALAFILGSLYFILIQKPLAAGVFLGIAIGCRITSGAMVIPLCLMLYNQENRRHSIQNLAKYSFGAFFIGTITFIPVIWKYGGNLINFFTRSSPIHLSALQIIKKATLELWGEIGIIAFIIVLAFLIFRPSSSLNINLMSTPKLRLQIIACILTLFLFIGLFLILPHESGYLIPIIPFTILLLGNVLNRKLFITFCLALLFSPFLMDIKLYSINSDYAIRFNILRRQIALDILKGPIISNHIKRKRGISFIEQVLSRSKNLREKAVIIAGWWLPQIEVCSNAESQRDVKFVELLDESKLKKYLDEGFKIYYLSNQRKYNLDVYGVDLHRYGAKPLF